MNSKKGKGGCRDCRRARALLRENPAVRSKKFGPATDWAIKIAQTHLDECPFNKKRPIPRRQELLKLKQGC